MFPLKVATHIILLSLFSSYPSHFRFTLPSFPLEAYIAIPGSHSHSRISYSPSKFTIPFQDHIPIPNLGKMKRVARVTPWGSHLPGGRGREEEREGGDEGEVGERERKGMRGKRERGNRHGYSPHPSSSFPTPSTLPTTTSKIHSHSTPHLTLLSVPSNTTSVSSNIML